MSDPSATMILRRLRDVRGIRGITYRAMNVWDRSAFAMQALTEFSRLVKRRQRPRPAVTAVVVGRNDDYMPDFEHRLHATIEWNSRYLAQETVFVEWNPPEGRALLSVGLTRRFLNLRAYVVSAAIHSCICENADVKLLEFHAKNVGIRRAQSEWIVATNADAVFGPDSIRRVLDGEPKENVVWSAERVDIAWREGRTSDVRLRDCLRYLQRIPFHALGTGEFTLASKALWERAGGYDESLVRHRLGADSRGVAQMIAHGGQTVRSGTVLHLAHPSSCTTRVQPHHGEWASLDGVPYHNGPDWGLADRNERRIADRVWLLE